MTELHSQAETRRELRKAIAKSLVAPLLLLAFFFVAPRWFGHEVKAEIRQHAQPPPGMSAEMVQERMAALDRLDLDDYSRHAESHAGGLHESLQQSGVVARFERLHWGLVLSLVLVGLLVAGFGAIFLLHRAAQGSDAALILRYRQAWRIAVALALANVLLLVPLLAYAFFELTLLAVHRFYPQVLIGLLIGAVIALWQSGRILLSTVPLEYGEAMARVVTETDAPELWRDVRAAAGRLQTSPPDNIIIGMQLNFYVTELAVHHTGGKTEGKTLFLSHPLLKQLSEPEVLAVIGHELGHFIGEDTKMTRHFYPLRQKAQAVLYALAHAGWTGVPSMEIMNTFGWSFEGTVSKLSRVRELMADAKGAELTSPETQARALVRLQVVLEAFNREFLRPKLEQNANPFDLPIARLAAEHFAPEDAFWPELFEQRQPHPMDSHPPLKARLAGLGQSMDRAEARALAGQEERPAYEAWFGERAHLFRELVTELEETLGDRRQEHATAADLNTPEGRALLEGLFPEKKWRARAGGFWVVALLIAVLTALPLAVLLLGQSVNEVPYFWVWAVLFLALPAGGLYRFFQQHYGAELTVNADGIAYTGWRRPIRFAEIEIMSAINSYGSIVMMLTLVKGAGTPWKLPLRPLLGRKLNFPLRYVKGKEGEIAMTIFRYFKRDVEGVAG